MKNCLNCNNELSGQQRKFCCKRCDDQWKYKNNKSTTTCETCGKPFQYPSKKVSNKPKYCSRDCSVESTKNPVKITAPTEGLSSIFLSQENPNVKGSVSEKLVQIYLELFGYQVFEPSADSGRIDLVAIKGSETIRVQIKTVQIYKGNKFYIDFCKRNKNKTLRYTKDEIDCVLAYNPFLSSIVKIPGELVWGKAGITFTEKSQGNYCGTSKFIEDYTVFHL